MAESPSGARPDRRRRRFLETLYVAHLLASPTTSLLPLARRLPGRTGVQTGPYLVIPVTACVHGAVRPFQRAEGRSPRQRSAAGWFLVTWELATPVLAALPRRTVVLRGRSPLWGHLLDVVLGVVLDVSVRRRAHRRRSARSTELTTTAAP